MRKYVPLNGVCFCQNAGPASLTSAWVVSHLLAITVGNQAQPVGGKNVHLQAKRFLVYLQKRGEIVPTASLSLLAVDA